MVKSLADAIAETIWRAEYRRATGRERNVDWSFVSPNERDKYLYLANAIALGVQTRDDALISVTAALAATISILECTPKAKSVAPSNKMFDQMLEDYRSALEKGRRALALPSAMRESVIGGTNFCGHGMMASLCPTCRVSYTNQGAGDAEA